MARYYVYALIDPEERRPRYIGKGLANRTEQHFHEASASVQDLTIGVETEEVFENDKASTPENETGKKEWLRSLMAAGSSHADIARVIACDLDESTALTLESFLITHVYGLGNGNLFNAQSGRHAERFRPFGYWGPWGDNDKIKSKDKTRDPGYYVYVLRDPEDVQGAQKGVFYVGKGCENRINAHFLEANGINGDPGYPERLRKVQMLLARGLDWDDIGYVVARVATEVEAFRIEALLIKFVYGLTGLSNLIAGHHDCTIRPKDAWGLLPNFDLPRVLNPGARQDRSDMLQLLLAEGLAKPLDWIRQQLQGRLQFGDYKVLDSGELGMEAPCGGTTLKVFTRRKKIQLELRPRSLAQRLWMQQRMEALGASHLLRADMVFIPPLWRGARGMTDSAQEAATRAFLMNELASARSLEDLSPPARLLIELLLRHSDHQPDDYEPEVPADDVPTAHPDTFRETPPPNPQEDGGGDGTAPLPNIDFSPGYDCVQQLLRIADQFPDIEFDQPRHRKSGEISIQGLIGAEGEEVGAILKIFCRKSGIGLELRWRGQEMKIWLLDRLTRLGCTSPKGIKPEEVVFLPSSWKGSKQLARTMETVVLRVAQLMQIVTTTDPGELGDEARRLLYQ